MAKVKTAMTGEQLRELLESKQLTLTKAAEKLSVNRSTLHRWLVGDYRISRAMTMMIRAEIGGKK